MTLKISGLRLGGPWGLDPSGSFTRFVPVISFHHPSRPCWLWAIELRRCVADEHRALRYFRMPGEQDMRFFQLWNWSLVVTWQEAGRFKSHAHRQRWKLSKLFGVNFD